jgi:hypothetical protein
MNREWLVPYTIGFACGYAWFLLYLFVKDWIGIRRRKHMARAWDEGRTSSGRVADNPYRREAP